jgi:hypothetical protein
MPKKIYVQDAYNKKRIIPVYSIKIANQVMYDSIVNFPPENMLGLKDYILANAVVSNTVITNNLYANYGDIADLRVNKLRTADVIDGAAVLYYIEIEDQYIKFIEATRLDAEPQVQYTNYLDELLYWTDDTKIAFSTEATSYPVMVYQYDKDVKMQFAFINDGTYNTPMIQLGEGDGVLAESGKVFIHKDTDGLYLKYHKQNTGELVQISMTDDGISFLPFANGINLEDLKIYDDGFIAKWKGESSRSYDVAYDGNGYISKITDKETLDEITVSKISGNMP